MELGWLNFSLASLKIVYILDRLMKNYDKLSDGFLSDYLSNLDFLTFR